MVKTGCPRCGAGMVRRAAKKSGETFWGCSFFPKCQGTRSIDDPKAEAPLDLRRGQPLPSLRADQLRVAERFLQESARAILQESSSDRYLYKAPALTKPGKQAKIPTSVSRYSEVNAEISDRIRALKAAGPLRQGRSRPAR
jgi:ssDNA-binding Zn-finger/Zn-ribbon topoisomerase 1